MTTRCRADPGRIVEVEGWERATFEAIIDHLESSTNVDHFVYREAELDALYSQLEIATRNARRRNEKPEMVAQIAELRDAVHEAHDLVGVDDPHSAATRLRAALRLVPVHVSGQYLT